MKIGVDARPLSYPLTGIGIYLKHLLEAIGKLSTNHEWFLVSNAPIINPPKTGKWRKIEGNRTEKLISSLWMQTRAPIFAVKNRIDLFWGTRQHLPILLPPGMKTILTIHDIVHRLYPETMALPNLVLERILMKPSLKRADRIITNSLSTAHDLKRYYSFSAGKIRTIYPGTPKREKEVCHQSIHPDTYFLFVGTWEPRKNLLRVLEAFERVSSDIEDVKLVVAGSIGWKNRLVIEKVRNLVGKGRIITPGYVAEKTLCNLYENALCLLFPSLYEGFGFPILEGMDAGVPVITSNGSSMAEVAGNAGLLVDPEDVGSISRAMKGVALDSRLRKYLVEKGKERVRSFSWDKCARETLALMEGIMET